MCDVWGVGCGVWGGVQRSAVAAHTVLWFVSLLASFWLLFLVGWVGW